MKSDSSAEAAVCLQVNYWEDVTNPLIMSHYTGEASSGATVIGLLPNTMYVMDVQVYNSAGLGPVSEKNKQRTYNSGSYSQSELPLFIHLPKNCLQMTRVKSILTDLQTTTFNNFQPLTATCTL